MFTEAEIAAVLARLDKVVWDPPVFGNRNAEDEESLRERLCLPVEKMVSRSNIGRGPKYNEAVILDPDYNENKEELSPQGQMEGKEDDLNTEDFVLVSHPDSPGLSSVGLEEKSTNNLLDQLFAAAVRGDQQSQKRSQTLALRAKIEGELDEAQCETVLSALNAMGQGSITIARFTIRDEGWVALSKEQQMIALQAWELCRDTNK